MTDAATQSLIAKLMPGYRGVAQSWECDLMGHLNVSHYFGRSSDHASFTRFNLGMAPRDMVADEAGGSGHEDFHRAGDTRSIRKKLGRVSRRGPSHGLSGHNAGAPRENFQNDA